MNRIVLKEDGNILIITIPAETTLQELAKYIQENISGWQTHKLIWDLRNFNFTECTPDEVSTFVYRLKNYSPVRNGKKTAFVVSDKLGYGFTRMYIEKKDDSVNCNIFYNIEEAEDWINNKN